MAQQSLLWFVADSFPSTLGSVGAPSGSAGAGPPVGGRRRQSLLS